MKQFRFLIVPVGILALGALLMYLFIGMREDSPRRSPQPRVKIVEASAVQLGQVAAEVEGFGTVTSASPVEIYAEVAGKIMPGDVPFRPAQAFNEGDVLLRLDDRRVQLDRQAAISDLLNALANFLPEIKVDFPDRYRIWQAYFDSISFDHPLPLIPDADNQKIKLYLSRFNVYKLFFAVRDLEIQLEKYEICAPFAGSIVTADLRFGSSARIGSLLGTIIDLENLEVELPLAAPDVLWINLDEPVTFKSSEFDGEWEGRIRRVGSSIDPRTQTIPIYVELGERPPGALLEGVFFEADLSGKIIESAIEVPRRAIYDERFVYLVIDGQLEYREVSVVRYQKNSVIVNAGLNSGDTLVVEPLQGVAPGMLAEARIVTLSERLK